MEGNKRSVLGLIVVPLLLTPIYFAGNGEHPAGMSPNNNAISKASAGRVDENAASVSVPSSDNPSVTPQLETSGTIASVGKVGAPPEEDTTKFPNDIFDKQQHFYQHIGDLESDVDELGEPSAPMHVGDYSVDVDSLEKPSPTPIRLGDYSVDVDSLGEASVTIRVGDHSVDVENLN